MAKNNFMLKLICGSAAFIVLLFAVSPVVSIPSYISYASTNLPAEINSTVNSQQLESEYTLLEDVPQPLLLTNKPVYDKYTLQERKNLNLPLGLPDFTYYYGEKTVYLTFDDGPDPENTPAILKILKDNNIKATFFVVGTQVEKTPHLIKLIFDEGHAIGNHTYNHIYRDLYKSPSSYMSQLAQTDEKIKNIIGVRPRISRAPGGSSGSFTKAYWDGLKYNGYIEVGWNISSGDASSAKAPQIVQNISRQLENKFLWSHAIVLMHDGRGHNETVTALPAIIKLFKDHNFEFRVINLETPPAW
jgi:peptidoglycan/xylan/chitin deacetylase (PgdA/CDA1 family)